MSSPAHSATHIMSAAAAAAVRPRERLTVSEWADRHRVLTSKQSGEVGRWRTSRNPMLKEIMDCLSAHSGVKEVAIMKSSQVGVTEASVNWLGYIIDHANYPAMVIMPTLEARDTWKVQKLNPLLSETPAIRDILGGLRSRDATNSKDMIDFPGGILFLAGGNSPNSYAQKSVRFLMMDDLDRFPSQIGEEGDPVELARNRIKSFPRHKILLASTPTIKGASMIEREFLSGDQRRSHVACPHCGERQTLKWSNVKANPQLTDAWYACEHNGCEIAEHHKTAMLAGAVWIPDAPEKKNRSYHISAIYAPIGLGPSWLDLVTQFKRICKDPVQLKTFINQNLGEPWEDQTDKLKANDLARRADPYALGDIPPSCLALTAGIDTQDKWLAITLMGWGADGKHWILDWTEIQGDTTAPQVWDELQAWLHLPRFNSFGKPMTIRAAGIDSRGHRGEQVKDFVMRPTLKIPAYAIQGSTSRLGRAIAQSGSYPTKTRTGKTVRHGYCAWNIGTEYCKDFLFANLAADNDRPQAERVFSFPQGLPDEYYDGLLSEVYDPEKKRYIPRIGAKHKRNEPLDTAVYAWAIGQHRDINLGRGRTGRPDPNYWARLQAMLEPENFNTPINTPVLPEATPATPPPAVRPQPKTPNSFAKSDWAKRGFK